MRAIEREGGAGKQFELIVVSVDFFQIFLQVAECVHNVIKGRSVSEKRKRKDKN